MTVHGVCTDGIPTTKNVDKGSLVKALPKLFVQRVAVDGLFVTKEQLVPWSTKGGFAITLHTTSDNVTVAGESILLDAAEAERLSETYRVHLNEALDMFTSYGDALFAVFHTVAVDCEDAHYKVIIKKK